MTVLNMDCVLGMRLCLADNSVDAIVTDPPYELGFMGKAWDATGIANNVEMWREALRVLKPGGHLLAFSGARTYHRMACAIEDAGFEIRDQIMWIYGSGFPKSHNGPWGGTALKPAHEPIVVARKPLVGTVADNHAAHGTGALNIDACRIAGEPWKAHTATGLGAKKFFTEGEATIVEKAPHDAGRWPANLIHDGSDEVVAAFPAAPGAIAPVRGDEASPSTNSTYGTYERRKSSEPRREADRSAARFFYCAKASRAERNIGCGDMEKRPLNWSSGTENPGSFQSEGTDRSAQNNHPTVKPLALMQYLCRLVTPAGGLVLDPFTGSGSTWAAAKREGFQFVGFELDARYCEIARRRAEAA